MYDKFLSSRSKKGFTLVEMLIVVAIIAILVAIAIPVFSAQLETARQRVDDGNLRSAESLAVAACMLDDLDGEGTPIVWDTTSGNAIFFADVDPETHALKVVQGTEPAADYGQTADNKEKIIKVTVNDGFEIVKGDDDTGWVTKTAAGGGGENP